MAFARFALLSLLTLASAREVDQLPKKDPVLNQATSQGCFDALPAQVVSSPDRPFNTPGMCVEYCKAKEMNVSFLQNKSCFCSLKYPAKAAMVHDNQCNTPCPGYPAQACGGQDAFSVYNNGIELEPGSDDGANEDKTSTTSTSAAPTKSAASTTIHVASTTIAASTYSEGSSTTKSEQESGSRSAAEEASGVANAAGDSTIPTTPSPTASTVTNNGALRFSSPVGNVVNLMRQFSR
ncbi:hypothetical protein FHETE_9357 [Fusarium heterosporum]|uniref:WSC domain-containing protein n=1 Tax=Fusarium heterosporum TaxID=42747 RepID=A0A8H5SYL9_FUSHE|nr:hypothetical protein FHETE_9357 [Fusarium heterosporum]